MTTRFTLAAGSWTDLGPTPCQIQLLSTYGTYAALYVVDTVAPVSLDADANVLSQAAGGNSDETITAPGCHVYARAMNGTATVAVTPVASGGGSFTPAQTFPATVAFVSGDTTGTGGTNGTIVQVVPAKANRTYLEIVNNGTADAELWFGARPADADVSQTPRRGVVLPAAGGGRVYDTKIPLSAIYATTTAAGRLSVIEG
jgi:hypothetical protein